MTRLAKYLSLAAALAFAAPLVTVSPLSVTPAFAKHGADDPAGDDRGGHGPGHASLEIPSYLLMAKNGADDPAGDDRGGHGPGHT